MPEIVSNSASPQGKPKNGLKIAILGIRGIPACYGGFETFAEELAPRLVAAGHHVTVYGRSHVIDYSAPVYRGVAIKLLPAPKHKYLETPIHTLLCLLDLVFKTPREEKPDVVLVCNAANSPFIWLARLGGFPVAVNVDGIERLRAKWNRVGKLWYRLGEICSVWFASEVVADAEVIRRYYLEHYHRDSVVIRYGTAQAETAGLERKLDGDYTAISPDEVFSSVGVEPGRYLLYVSRLEPENNAHVVIGAYNRLPEELKDLPLLIVGDAPYAKEYIERLHAMAQKGVIFAGYRFGNAYHDLQAGAYCYIQATEVGGTHPALVEAMGFANCIVANGTPENQEVLGEDGLFYPKNSVDDLSRLLRELVCDEARVRDYRRRAYARAKRLFSWNEISAEYEKLFARMAQRR